MKSIIAFSLCAQAAGECYANQDKGFSGVPVAFPGIVVKAADCCQACEENDKCSHAVFNNNICTQYGAAGAETDVAGAIHYVPGAPPAPPPAPTPPGTTHYGKPPCLDDEMFSEVTDTDGGVCSPHCGSKGECPSDMPGGATATPNCALTDDDTQEQYCALLCGGTKGDCPVEAECAMLAVVFGLCVYPGTTVPYGGAPNKPLTFKHQAQDPEQPHLAQAWTALSKGDGLPNQVGQESYIWDDARKIKAHWYKYDGCQKLSIHDSSQLHHIQGGERNYYLGCDALDCCYGDFSMKKWDINNGRASTVSFVGFEDTTELNDGPVSQAEHWQEVNKIPFTTYNVNYDHFVTRGNGTDVISHRINFEEGTGSLFPPGEILYANFEVQHDIDAFIQSEFQLPDQCKRNNLLNCGDNNIKRWEATHFKHDSALRMAREASVSV